MESIEAFTLAKHQGPYETWPLRTRLQFNNNETGTEIPGYIIEGQYRCDEGYLLITSHDCPFEESNDFILLGECFEILATEQLLVPYASFLLNAHWPVSSDSLLLHYYERLFFTLTIRKNAGLFRSRHRLVLKPFNEPENDSAANASIAELQRRLQAIREQESDDKINSATR